MNPVMVPLREYLAGQRAKFVYDLVDLHHAGMCDPAFIEARRTLYGIPPEEVPAAMLEAHLLHIRQEAQAA